MPDMIPVRSSSVVAVGWDAGSHELHVTYASGRTYVYAMVPRSVFEALLQADSIGTFVNTRVKPRYPARTH